MDKDNNIRLHTITLGKKPDSLIGPYMCRLYKKKYDSVMFNKYVI